MAEYFDREIEVAESTLTISQQYVADVGGVVWDAALVLNAYLETLTCQGLSFVELGAGTGVSGLVAAALGGNSIITDLSDFVPLMERNIQQNKEVVSDRTRAMELDWKAISNGNLDVAKHPCLGPDYILISDCIYYKGANIWLADTIKALTKANTTVLISMELREDKVPLVKEFFIMLRDDFNLLLVEDIPEQWKCDDIQVWSARRK